MGEVTDCVRCGFAYIRDEGYVCLKCLAEINIKKCEEYQSERRSG